MLISKIFRSSLEKAPIRSRALEPVRRERPVRDSAGPGESHRHSDFILRADQRTRRARSIVKVS